MFSLSLTSRYVLVALQIQNNFIVRWIELQCIDDRHVIGETSRETCLFPAGFFGRIFYGLFWCLLVFLILVVPGSTLQELHK